MTIQTIIKKAIKRLELEGKILTPDFYAESFCKEAKKAGLNFEDCGHIERYTKTLNKEFQNELKEYRINSMAEFTRFIISKLNRTNPTQCSKMLEAHSIFIKKILHVVEVLHNKEATTLARKSLDILNSQPTTTQIDQYKQLWTNFLGTYDDTFLFKLKPYVNIDTNDLKETIDKLDFSLLSSSEVSESDELAKIASLLVSSLVPSISSSVNKDIATISDKIKEDPSILFNPTMESEIRSAITLRISLDKNSLKEMFTSLDGVLDKLSFRLIDMIDKSDNTTLEIQNIKHELETYSEASTSNFRVAHKKLYMIAVALEENTHVLSEDLSTHHNEVNSLSQKVRQLEHELDIVKKESKEDFLTKLLNKRGLDELFITKEGEFDRYERNFSIVMFDLDDFKHVNDNYGHGAGDAVLSAFAKILKQEARSVDVIGRFGGEEFIAILSETDSKGASVFAEKVREHVQNARFVYKGNRIEITVSAGVSERIQHSSLAITIKEADQFLYKAKNDGKNRIVNK